MASTANDQFKRTLIDFSFPNRTLSNEILLTLGFTVFIAIASQVSFTPPSWYTNIFSSKFKHEFVIIFLTNFSIDEGGA